MSKIFKAIGRFFAMIFKFFDRLVITPISKSVYRLAKSIKNSENKVESILNRPHMVVYISLVFAIGLFFLVDSKVINLVETEAEVISDQIVNVTYNEEAYVIEGIPSTVDITLIGKKNDIYLAKQLGDHEVSLDLTNYGVGEHKVYLAYNQAIDSINYKIDPSYVMVVIKEKVSESKKIGYDLLNEDKLDSTLSINSVELAQDEVIVKGSQKDLDKIANVKALINLNDEKLKEAGTYNLSDLVVVAYDKNGNSLPNVEVVPEKIDAKVTLDSNSIEVPLKIMTKGTPTVGYAISSMQSDLKKITVYGDNETLDNIKYIPVTININGLNSNKTYSVNINKPNGVRSLSETKTTVDVKVGKETSKEIRNIAVETRNLGEGLIANGASINDTSVTVIVKGVSNVLSSLNSQEINAYVDLSGLGAGTHSVNVQVEGNDSRVQYASKVKTIEIVISAK